MPFSSGSSPHRPNHLIDSGQSVGPLLSVLPSRRPAVITGCKVSVVIPTLNEAANLPHVLPRVPTWVHELIVVDGRSTDGTVAVAQSLRPEARIVLQPGKGKGDALRAGFAAATGDVIVMLDADGSTDPEEIPAFVGLLLTGFDLVKGSRFLQGGGTTDMPWYRRLGNWGFVVLSRLLFGSGFSDLCYGYNAFWADILPRLDLDGDGFEIETMINVRALQAGFRIAEVPSFEADRIYGESRLRTIPDGWRVLTTIVKEWWYRDRRRAQRAGAAFIRAHEQVRESVLLAAGVGAAPASAVVNGFQANGRGVGESR